ncbi:MAG: AraC family transcriptional regulator [Pseudomonadota bacterium]
MALSLTPTPLPAEKGFPVGALSELPQLLRDFGHDPWELLETHGVRRDMMQKPLTPLPVMQHGRILEAAVEVTSCEHLGLLLGQRATLENAGPLRSLVFNAPTSREAIDALVRFGKLWYPALQIDFSQQDGYACLSLSMEGRFPGHVQLMTAYLTGLVKHLEGIFDRSWRPAQVQLSCQCPETADAFRRFFRAPVLFDQPRHALLFAIDGLDAPRAGLQFDVFLQQHLIELESKSAPDFCARVRHVIENLLPSGDCNVERVAELFAMHRFTLYRYLQESGTTFEALLSETRAELAVSMLEHTAMPIGGIALALGYSTSTSFGRAFTRWFGLPPKDWRKGKLGIGHGVAPAAA